MGQVAGTTSAAPTPDEAGRWSELGALCLLWVVPVVGFVLALLHTGSPG